MSRRGDAELAADILQAIGRVESYVANLDFDSFYAHSMARDAVVRNLEIIGEAAKQLSPEFRAMHDAIAWREVAGMRDRLIHHYISVNWEIVWRVVTDELPKLKAALTGPGR
ncbi:MAG: HepT-like ribonuclease domain-containing protein [Rhodospirillales bacterium]